jgi:hypothetical protein
MDEIKIDEYVMDKACHGWNRDGFFMDELVMDEIKMDEFVMK